MSMLDIQNFLVTHQPKNGHFFTIAIDGRGGSGKTALVELLRAELPGFIMLNGDDYFEPIDDPIVWGDFNDERFIQDVIEPLKRAGSFTYRPYDWHVTPHITEKKIEVTKGICLERCYSFGFDLDWDLKIWVETPKEACLERGLTRENMPREKTILAWEIWQAREDDYIQKYQPQEKADVVIDGLKSSEEQLK
jgi:uridine kinase